MNYLGDFIEDATVRILFTTHDKEGGAIAPSSAFEVDDFHIYKDSLSEKITANGLNISSPFAGLHALLIDTSNDTGDAGFWETGSEYFVVLDPDETVDGESVVKVVGSFSLVRSGGALFHSAQINGKVDDILTDTGSTLDTKINTIDGIVDDILLDTGTTIPGLISAIPTLSADDVLDEPVEGAITLRQSARVLLAYLAGKASGGGTATVSFRNQADNLNRIVMTVDANGNRSAVVLNLA